MFSQAHGQEQRSPSVGRASLGPLRRLVPYLLRYRGRILAAALALVVAAGTVLGLGAGLRTLIDRGFGGGDGAMLDQALVAMLVVIALLAGASYARFYLVSWIGERVVADLRRDVFAHVVRLDPGFWETGKTAEVISRLTADTTVLQVVVGSSVSVFLRNLLLFLGGTAMLLVTSPRLTLLVALVVPLVIAPIFLYGRRVRRLSRRSQDRIAEIGAAADETLAAVRTVQAFGHEPLEERRLAARAEEAFAVAVERTSARAALTAVVIALVFGAVGIILWIGGHDVLAGRLTPGALSAFVFYAVVVAGAVGSVSEAIGDIQRAAGAAERLFDLLATQPAIRSPASPRPLPEPPAGAVALERVTFHYPARPDESALYDFSLSIAAGERVALVGPSGAGKTTVFQLLLRFYDPQAGRVLIDGVDVREAELAAVRARIGLVQQDPVIFSGTARDNILYGRPQASEREVRAAAEAAHALGFIDGLPRGLDTFLGERGVRLSGGQRQRITIARTILRNPPVLLLDEATSALDAESERAVQQALDTLMAGRTTLVIAHRLATVQTADRIAVLDRGRLIATGTHRDLAREGGLYARLAALQFDPRPQGEGEPHPLGRAAGG